MFTCTGSGDARYTVSSAYGGGTYVTQTWNPPGPSTGSFSSGGVGATTDYSSSLVAQIQVTVTATWKPDTTLPSDPAPPNVWLCESSSADWDAPDKPNGSGKADDGVGPVGTDYKLDAGGYSGAASTSNAPASVPPAYWKKYTVSGNTVALPARTIRGEADASGSQGGYLVAHAGGYSVTVHATPYNYRRQNFSGDTTSVHIDNGLLTFHYVWSSTSGSLANLKGETIHENVVCSVQTDNPPFLWQPPPLTDISVAADASEGIDDINSYGTIPGELVGQAFSKPYKADHYDETQSFVFNDPAIMKAGEEQQIPGAVGPYTITKAVVSDPGSPSGYSFVVTKDSVTSDPINLP